VDQSTLDVVTAVGTVGAAVFAGWAALSSARAARVSRDLVLLERERDQERLEEAKWRQARRVTVDAGFQTVLDDRDRWLGVDAFARVTNASGAPISKVRVKMACDPEQWGPQLVGTIAPGDHIEIVARLLAPLQTGEFNSLVRFVDVDGRGWVLDARGVLAPDVDDNLAAWIEDGRHFAEREMSPEQRGTIAGASPAAPDIEAWRQQFDGE
jgi:hypothetical protein